jgi:hypothetical protein
VSRTPKIVKHSVKALKRWLQIARLCSRNTPVFSRSYIPVLVRSVRLCSEHRFLPDEAFCLGLFNPSLPPDEASRFISRKKLTRLQKSVNPESASPLLKNKCRFYRYAMQLGIPIPAVYAFYHKDAPGWSPDGVQLKSPEDWQSFLETRLPDRFVIKPAESAFGHGVRFFARTGDRFTDAFNRAYTSRQICRLMQTDPDHDSFVIQQRFRNHPDLVRLTGVEHLQTLRIITFTADPDSCRIFHAYLKLITGRNIVDNFEHGLTGNIQSQIDVDTGRLRSAVTLAKDGAGPRQIPRHPETQIPLDGFLLPCWHEVCELIQKIAPRFLPVKSIGWDVAITPDGPRVVEANIWWNPPNQHRCMDVILKPLIEAAGNH